MQDFYLMSFSSPKKIREWKRFIIKFQLIFEVFGYSTWMTQIFSTGRSQSLGRRERVIRAATSKRISVFRETIPFRHLLFVSWPKFGTPTFTKTERFASLFYTLLLMTLKEKAQLNFNSSSNFQDLLKKKFWRVLFSNDTELLRLPHNTIWQMIAQSMHHDE